MRRGVCVMKRLNLIFLSLVLCLTSSFGQLAGDTSPFSPTAMAVNKQKKLLAIAGKTANSIVVMRLRDGKILNQFNTELPPTGLAFKNGDLWATTSYSKGYLLKLNIKNGVEQQIAVGHGACAPVAHPVKDIIYVANQYNNDISVVDIDKGEEIKRIDVLRQPMTATISKDGRYLFVANLLPETRADIDTVASSVSIIDTETNEKIKDLQLANGSNALRDITISPDGKYVFVSHNLGRFQVPTTQLVQGWMNTSAISVIDAHKLDYLATVMLDQSEKGAAGSWGIDINNDEIIVAHSGTHDYSRIDYHKFINKLQKTTNKDNLSYDLQFIQPLRQRYAANGNGPREIKIVNDQLLVANYFSDNIELVDLNQSKKTKIVELNKGYLPDDVRMGEMIFNDASHCFQGWQSCNGCHPNDARVDGLNWDLLNDGIGNPKNCKSLLLSHETPPAMISGIRPTAEIAVRAGFRHIQFAQVSEEDAKKVDAYLKSLKPVPSPYLEADGQLSEKAEKGKVIFERVGCHFCHLGDHHTDLKQHTMGVMSDYDQQNTWDTPTLTEIWRTGPYMHDGRSATLEEVFTKEKHGLKHHELNSEEVEQLVEYLKSL
ncbi:MAG: hypothetical protein N4A71_15540 [Carboxylicivirga sp.]|jgi:YVTN family beta-propeller protein|nr:hypothetical protein [Carboxylicivirga sp.]